MCKVVTSRSGAPTPHAIEPHRHSQPTPAQPVCPSPKHQPPRNNQAEQTVLRNPRLIRGYSVRPIFLGSCVLAVKVSREADLRLSHFHCRVQDVFNLLDVRLLSRIEHQLLEVLSSQPAPMAPQPARPRISLPHSLCVHQCGAGAGLANAHGRRAISSLRRRALRRGSGRASRAAHAGRELDGGS